LARYRVAATGDVALESVKGVIAGRKEVCLARAEDGNFYALDDVCTHENFLLSGGELVGYDVECPQHGSRFNVKTGRVTGLPAVMPAKTYPVTVEGDEVFVDV
jgi:3-phenylpropionate/trans-cinnamate dioxygenase ferredoxin component